MIDAGALPMNPLPTRHFGGAGNETLRHGVIARNSGGYGKGNPRFGGTPVRLTSGRPLLTCDRRRIASGGIVRARLAMTVQLVVTAAIVVTASVSTAVNATLPAGASTTVNVCRAGCAYHQIAPALAAARPRDVVDVAPGTYVGGFSITKDLTLHGAGRGDTVIRGGGPVVTVGTFGAATEPAVTITGFTITGGITRQSPGRPYEALGGGIYVPPSAGYGSGASLTLTRSAVTKNRVTPRAAVDSGLPCGAVNCVFGQAGGGGLDSWGRLTLDRVLVTDNTASGKNTSDADGAGVYVQQGAATVERSVIKDNSALAHAPNGRFAEGAGLMVDTFFSPPGTAASLTLRHSAISHNTSHLTSDLPSFAGGALINMNANAGGIHVGDLAATVSDSTIRGNAAIADDPHGEPLGIDAGMLVGDGPLTMTRTTISDNHTYTRSATTADVGPDGSALELDGPGKISDLDLSHNFATSVTKDGAAAVNGALAVLNFNNDPQLVSIRNSRVSGNRTQAVSRTGSATTQGSGIFNNSLLRLQQVEVDRNLGTATGSTGVAQGGGIWNGAEVSGPPVELTLVNTRIVHNMLIGSPTIHASGGGLYTTVPISQRRVLIAHNRPDQCSGC